MINESEWKLTYIWKPNMCEWKLDVYEHRKNRNDNADRYLLHFRCSQWMVASKDAKYFNNLDFKYSDYTQDFYLMVTWYWELSGLINCFSKIDWLNDYPNLKI